MPDQNVTSNQFTPVTMPGVACKMQVHGAPIDVTFTPAGTVTRGMRLEPGDIIPIGATDAMQARRADGLNAILVFEVFG